MQTYKRPWPYLFVLVLAFVSSEGYAQVQTGSIYGQVTDAQGALLPGVTVTLTNPSIGDRTAVTTALGVYRFPELPPGNYTLTFQLANFQTLRRSEIPVSAGASVVLDVQLELGSISEVLTVMGESPMVDKRNTNIGASLDEELLDNIPSSRDPWTVLAWVPQVSVDRINVGGTESGQQSNFMGAGSMNDQSAGGSAQWSVDGVVITDMAATGSSPTYYDFDSFQEIEVSAGGHTAEIPYGNVGLNFITKQGGNDFAGQASFYGTGGELQSDNRPSTDEFDDVLTNKINKIRDWGFDVGGPMVTDKLWFWGAFRTQDISLQVLSRTFEPPLDATTLENYNLKFHGMATDQDKITFLWTRGDKIKSGRGAGARRPTNTTWDQSGPTNIFKIEEQRLFSDSFLLTGSYAYVGGGFQLIAKGGRDAAPILDLATGVWEDTTFIDYFTDRPQHQVRADGNYYLAEALGGDHELKFGFMYRDTSTTSASVYGNGNFMLTFGGEPAYVYLFRQNPEGRERAYGGKYSGAYLNDTWSTGRATFNLGVRVDVQTAFASASSTPANPVIPDLLPAIDFDGFESGTDWVNVTPRLGVTYDVTGDGRTIFRGNFATYASQRDQGNPDRFLITSDIATILFACDDPVACGAGGTGPTSRDQLVDINGDGVIGAEDALDWSGTDPFEPGPQLISTFDDGFSSPKSLEVLLGLEHEMFPDFAVGGNFIFRRNWNLVWGDELLSHGGDPGGRQGYPTHRRGGEFTGASPGGILTPADYEAVTEDGVTFFRLSDPELRGSGVHVQNRPDFSNQYMGFELTARKRLSRNWLLNSSFTWRDWTQDFECFDGSNPTSSSANCYQDPTNVAALDDNWIYQETSGSGKSDVWLGSKWQFKIGGMYQFPYGINVSGFLTGQQGNVFPSFVRVPAALRGVVGTIDTFDGPWDQRRYENLWYADIRFEKAIDMDVGRLEFLVDIFNLSNTNTTLGREGQRASFSEGNLAENELANSPLEIVNPRIFRFGVRIRF